MSASSSVQQVGGSGTSSSSSTSLSALPLNNEAVFRIELSFSSRKSSVIVMRCTARLYSLEGVKGAGPGDGEWKSVAYGVPCIQLMRDTIEHNSTFHIKLIIAEMESGIGLWECRLENGSKYNAMQNNFHTFSINKKPHAIQFANETEGMRMLESVQDLLYQKERAETVSFEKNRTEEAIFKKPKPLKKLSKKDISAPCNFKHVSGITVQRTRTCEDELRGTIQRKIRSMSLSSFTNRRKAKQRPQSEIVGGAERNGKDSASDSPTTPRKGREERGTKLGKSSSFRHKFKGSKKKMQQRNSLTITELRDDSAISQHFTRGSDNRRSLPSRLKRQQRPSLNDNTFTNGGPGERGNVGNRDRDQLSPTRSLSHSSGDLRNPASQSHDQVSHTPRKPVARSNTIQGGSSFNYTPYSKTNPKKKSTTLDGFSQGPAGGNGGNRQRPPMGRQYMSDMTLDSTPRGSVPQRMAGGRGYPGGVGPRYTHNGNNRSSFHEGLIPSTVHESMTQNGNWEANSYPNENWSSTMPRGWKTRSIPEIAHTKDVSAPTALRSGHGQEREPRLLQQQQLQQQQRRQSAEMGGSLQRINRYAPSRHRAPLDQQSGRPLTMSAQDISSYHHDLSYTLPMGVVPPPPLVESPSHVTSSHGDSPPKMPRIPEAQGAMLTRDPKPYAVVSGVGMEPRMEPGPPKPVSPNPLPSTFLPIDQTCSVSSANPEQYDLLNPRSSTSQATPTAEQYDSLKPAPGPTSIPSQYDNLNQRSKATPIQVAAPQVPVLVQQGDQYHHGPPDHQQGVPVAPNQPQVYRGGQVPHSQSHQNSFQGFEYPQDIPNESPNEFHQGAPQNHQGVPQSQLHGYPQPSHTHNARQQQQHQHQIGRHPRDAVMMTATHQHMRADTRVSPSHSQSMVSPIPVQSYSGNGTVHQAFNSAPQGYHGNGAIPSQVQPGYPGNVQTRVPIPPQGQHHWNQTGQNSVPVPVQIPTVPFAGRGDIRQTSATPLNGSIPGHQPAHYRTMTDSPRLRPHPVHGRTGHPGVNNSFDGNESVASSVDTDIAEYTEQMSRALEQFDNLVPQVQDPSGSIMQTTF